MKTHWLRSVLESFGILKPLPAPKHRARAKRKAPVRRKTVTPPPVAAKAPKARKAKPATVNHAAAVKTELLNAVAEALGRAPAELDPKQPKATIAVNGSLYTVINTVDALSRFQERLEKLSTVVKQPGVSRNALLSSNAVMAKQRRDSEDTKAYFEKQRQQQPTT